MATHSRELGWGNVGRCGKTTIEDRGELWSLDLVHTV